MAGYRGGRTGWAATGLISLLGIGLAVIHVWHAYVHGGSVTELLVGSVVPFAFALWIVYGGYWASRQGYQDEYHLYLLLWVVGGMVGLTGLGSITLIELSFHEMLIPDPATVLVSIATMGSVAGLLIGIYDVRSRRKTDLLTSLQTAATSLMAAEDRQTVADETVTIAHDVLNMDIAGVWLYDAETEELHPVAATAQGNDEFPEHPTFREGNSLSWQAFENGESMVVRDMQNTPGRHNLDTPLRSEIILPLGRQGVLNIGSTSPDAFDEVEISVAHILGSTAASALERADREETLREQQATLEQHNERLEQFASVLSHDLRNPLAVAQGRLELLQEECDSEHIRPVVDAHDRIDQMIEDLLLLAREGRSITETEPVEVAAVARDAWRVVDGDASLEIDCEDQQFTADRARLRQLFENLFRNALEHGGAEPTIRVGCSADGFFVADDGPGIPEDQREQVFEFGYTDSGSGTGLGLAIVHEIVEGHGWSVDISDSEAGGARFDVRVDPD